MQNKKGGGRITKISDLRTTLMNYAFIFIYLFIYLLQEKFIPVMFVSSGIFLWKKYNLKIFSQFNVWSNNCKIINLEKKKYEWMSNKKQKYFPHASPKSHVSKKENNYFLKSHSLKTTNFTNFQPENFVCFLPSFHRVII